MEAWAWVWDYADFRFLSAHRDTWPAGWTHTAPGAGHSTAILITGGGAVCQVGDRTVSARPGDVVWSSENTPYTLRVRSPEFEAVRVHFTARVAGARCLLALLGFPPALRDLGARDEFRELVRLQHHAPGGWRQRATALIASLVLRVVHERPDALAPTPTVRDARALRWVCSALRLAEQSGPRVGVNDLARAMACSASHLRRVFRACLGVSPHQWLLDRRLTVAAELLVETEEPVESVARKVGYEGLSHFHRNFKHRFGCTPAEYRARARPGSVAGKQPG